MNGNAIGWGLVAAIGLGYMADTYTTNMADAAAAEFISKPGITSEQMAEANTYATRVRIARSYGIQDFPLSGHLTPFDVTICDTILDCYKRPDFLND